MCADDWQGVVRKEDVRATEKEKVFCADGFRVGDVVRGLVVYISLLLIRLSPGEGVRELIVWATDQSWRSVELLPHHCEE